MNKNYIIEDDIDFFKELSNLNENENENKIIDTKYNETDELNNNEKMCLIEYKPLTEYYIKLPCNHFFNYKPLFREIYNQKTQKNHYSMDNLKKYQIKCPYCRTKHNNVLPYYKDMEDFNTKIIGVNWPMKLAIKSNYCQYKFKSGKRKNQLCNIQTSGEYCLCHARLVKKNREKEKQKVDTLNITCQEILKTGKNKGNICGCKVFKDGFCKRHQNKSNVYTVF